MTSMTDQRRGRSPAYTTDDIVHPDWCDWRSGHCEVTPDSSFLSGYHQQAPERVALNYGSTFGVGFTADCFDENNPKVGLRISTSESSEPGRGFEWAWETHLMEPEEAALLGRRLIEAAGAWRSIRTDQPTTRHKPREATVDVPQEATE